MNAVKYSKFGSLYKAAGPAFRRHWGAHHCTRPRWADHRHPKRERPFFSKRKGRDELRSFYKPIFRSGNSLRRIRHSRRSTVVTTGTLDRDWGGRDPKRQTAARSRDKRRARPDPQQCLAKPPFCNLLGQFSRLRAGSRTARLIGALPASAIRPGPQGVNHQKKGGRSRRTAPATNGRHRAIGDVAWALRTRR